MSGFKSNRKTDNPFREYRIKAIPFTSHDQDNDFHGGINCAKSVFRFGGWRHVNCGKFGLNGKYKGIHGILLNHNWHVLPFVEIKIRPLNFNTH